LSVYHFKESKIIDRLTVRRSENGANRAYLHAADAVSSKELLKLQNTLAQEGYTLVPTIFEDKPALEVRGFWFEKSLIKSLSENGWVKGPQSFTEEKDTRSLKEKFKSQTLRATSYFFMLADLCFAMYGYKGGRKEDVAAGISYFVGSATMGAMGTAAQSQAEIRKQVKKLIEYTKEHNLNFDQNLTVPIVTENNKRDVFHKIIDTLQTYPAEIGNSFTAMAGGLIATSALRHHALNKSLHLEHPSYSAKDIKDLRISGWQDFGLGTSTVISGAIGALVKEKKIDPDDPKKHGLDAVWQWVQSKPLRVAAFGYMASTFCHTLSTYKNSITYKKNNDVPMLKTLKWRKGFIINTIIGEVLLALSSKGHGHGIKSDISTEDSVISVAAEIIAQQKPEMQTELIANIGNFLGREDVLGGKNKNMQQRLAGQVELMKSNPWALATGQVKAKESDEAALPVPEKECKTKRCKLETPPAAWQAKMAEQKAAQGATPQVAG
jgi:hypothetical protein